MTLQNVEEFGQILGLPPGPGPIVPVQIQPQQGIPKIYPSKALAVGTSWSALWSYQLQSPLKLSAIMIIGSPDTLTNGVEFYVQYGRNQIGTISNPVGLIVPLSFGFETTTDEVILQPGEEITLYGSAQTAGSYMQIIVVGVQK
jgi:hypothetical protein